MRRAALFWVQHLLGSGHLRRTAAIASALSRYGMHCVVASGGMPLSHLDLGAAELVQLPPVRAADAGFSGLVDRHGNAVDDRLLAQRRNVLCELVADLAPAAVVTETFPFGRRQLRHEVLALLDATDALEKPPLIVCSVRDILQKASKPERFEQMRAIAMERYDRVMVHGDPRLITFGDTFPFADALGERLVHTGYIAAPPAGVADMDGPGSQEVIVSAGGGAVGRALLEAAAGARPLSAQASNLTWRLLTGDPSLASSFQASGDCIVAEPNRADFALLLARCAVSVSQGGYNTITDLFGARARAVVVPYGGEGETEQTERATRLAWQGSIVMLPEAELSPRSLARSIDQAMVLPHLSPGAIDLDGAERSAELLLQWMGDD